MLALPRSRTYWLSKFLTTDTCKCEHDGCCNYSSIDEMLEKMPDGNCDTALALVFDKLKDSKVVIIYRNYHECLDALKEIGFEENSVLKKIRYKLLDAAVAFPCVGFHDLDKEDTCRWLFEYLTEEKFDRERWLKMKDEIAEVSVPDELLRFKSNAANLHKMFGEYL